jgi:hypothetical protein
MTKSKDGILDNTGGAQGKAAQMSTITIQNKWRAMTPRLFEEAQKILDGRNDALKVAIIKMGMSKVVPDLSATDLTTGGDKIVSNVIHLPSKRSLDTPPETDRSPGAK